MHYRKYRRATVNEALQAVRDELGPSALVLSTRMVPVRGIRGWMGEREVEITAAVERPEVSEDRIARPADRPEAQQHAHARGIAARLEASGLDRAVAEAIAQHPSLQRRGAGSGALRAAVAETLSPLVASDSDELAPVEVFVGPPGAGKTTTIAKIAARTRVRKDARVWLVAADGFRVGAVEQLRLYANIIGSPFLIARSGDELARTLDGLRRPMLVDTAGRSPRDAGNADVLATLTGRRDVRRHLVLPATTSAPQARRIIERFGPTKPDRLLLTRLDEAESIAPLVGVLEEFQVPVSYLAHGQNVPDDIEPATPAALTDWVLGDAISGACA